MSGPVVVAVPTFRRVGWAGELLSALVEQAERRPPCRVVVLDNDPDASAAVLADHPAVRSGGAQLHHVGLGDVVSVRNAALELALEQDARFLVLVDDDELPSAGWLDALVDAQVRWQAQVVAGPVRQEVPVRQRPHVRALLVREGRDAGPFDGDVGAGNVLLDLDLVRRTGVRFDPRLGHGGGEDTLFFRQLARAGARFAWAPDAVVVERAVPARLTAPVLLRRSYRNGRSSLLVDQVLGSPPGLPRRAGALLGAGAAYLPAAVLAAARGDREHAWRRLYQVARHAGRLRGGAGPGGYGGPARPSAPGGLGSARPDRGHGAGEVG